MIALMYALVAMTALMSGELPDFMIAFSIMNSTTGWEVIDLTAFSLASFRAVIQS